MRRWREALLGVLVLLAAGGSVLVQGLLGGRVRGRAGERANVVLITIDAMRADRLSASGYHRNTTPFIDSVAREGVRFTRAYSVSSWTAPSLASLMTGVLPTVHGVLHGSFRVGAVRGQEVIPDALVRWPEMMRGAGYSTYGITANGHLHSRFGFARGFDRYRCLGFSSARRVCKVLGEWRDEIRRSEPYFLWVHLLDPHGPYRANEPWFSEYRAGRGHRPELEQVSPVRNYLHKLGLASREDERLEYVVALYDSEVAYSDSVVRELVAELGLDGDDLLLISADHGEEFLDHEGFGHGRTLYEESIRVPLVVRLPHRRLAGTVVDAPVSLLDLPPTVLELIGAETPARWDGRSLAPLLEDRASAAAPIYAHLSRGGELRGLIDGAWKYIYLPRQPADSELYDLAADPLERSDLAGERRPRVGAMRRQLIERSVSLARRRHTPARATLTPEQVEALRSMGYVE